MIPIVPAMRLIKTFASWKTDPENQGKNPEIDEVSKFVDQNKVIDISSNELNENTQLGDVLRKKRHRERKDQLSRMNPRDILAKSIIFIHGWRWEGEFIKKDVDNTFGKLPHLLSVEFACNHEYFRYKTGITNKTKSFYFVAKTLSNYLLNIKADYINFLLDDESLSDSEIGDLERNLKVAIIAHSAGGIIIRKCMTFDPFGKELEFVKHITLIASPAIGSGWLNSFELLPGISDQVRELRKDSAFINDLNFNWLKWRENNTGCKSRCIYGAEDEVVNASNASILDKDAVCMLGVGHSEIKEVKDLDNELYKTLVRFLNEVSF